MQYITYYRVSTKKQDLGLEAQQTIIRNYLKDDDEVLASYSEKETGTKKRVQLELEKAIEHCKQTGSTLLIAKLDRLARNVSFISTLMDSNVEFKALDMPHANKLTIHIFAAIAEHEAELISQRTKAALQELKKKGVVLGKPENFNQVGRDKGVRTNKAKASNNENNRKAKAYIKSLLVQGLNHSQIAKELNTNGFTTSRGKRFQAVQVQRLS
ncbi:DNA invertase Pin-like site-specific DNA recombinase [Maribacter spongiicola]|uniref:DNA invertase Pin-like site-specific DNA recombinase n=1 Tax=Maribacter spongiicola TaxID=1206753 RepID=A0A4R7K4B0_9FLAO|nr:recombinase family protein [Maribacter spongiicola]TDT44957.1 DNA invertase Pin-like site-specific DNA recombinase [Maribacter spongiicola]